MARKLLYVGNDAGYFMAHRYSLAAAAKTAGWEVHVASPAGPVGRIGVTKQVVRIHVATHVCSSQSRSELLMC